MAERYRHFDGLRGLAAVNVFLSHAVVAFDLALYSGAAEHAHGDWELSVSAWPFLLPVAGANFSVCLFFVLSGFVLQHAFASSRLSLPALAVKRFLRLGLPILAVTLLSWALLAGGFMANHATAPATRSSWLAAQFRQPALLSAALVEGSYGSLLGPWDFATSYDSSLWTMSIEFAGSLLLIGLLGARRLWSRAEAADRLTVGALLLVTLALYPRYLALIPAGAALACLLPRAATLCHKLPAWLTGGLLFLALLLGTVPYSAVRGPAWDLLAALPGHGLGLPWQWIGPGAAVMDPTSTCHGLGALLLVLAIQGSPLLQRLLSGPLPHWLGTVSFPLYLLHIPVLTSVGCGGFLWAQNHGLGYAAAVAVATLCYAVATLTLAALAEAVVERPAMRFAAVAAGWVNAVPARLLAMPTRSTRTGRPPAA